MRVLLGVVCPGYFFECAPVGVHTNYCVRVCHLLDVCEFVIKRFCASVLVRKRLCVAIDVLNLVVSAYMNPSFSMCYTIVYVCVYACVLCTFIYERLFVFICVPCMRTLSEF